MSDDLDPRLAARLERELAAVPAFRGSDLVSRPRSTRWKKLAVVGTAVAVSLVLIGGTVAREVLAPRSSAGTLAVAGRDLPELVQASEVVVIGTVLSQGGTRVISRAPYDITREDPNFVAIAQDYAFAVESSIKGDVTGTITVTVSSLSRVKRDPFWYEFKSDNIPPRVGSRYALFLRRLPWDSSVYVLSFEPSQFELGTMAVVRSRWLDARTYFPDRPVADFLNALRDAAASP
jgi:hypothetical protein